MLGSALCCSSNSTTPVCPSCDALYSGVSPSCENNNSNGNIQVHTTLDRAVFILSPHCVHDQNTKPDVTLSAHKLQVVNDYTTDTLTLNHHVEIHHNKNTQTHNRITELCMLGIVACVS